MLSGEFDVKYGVPQGSCAWPVIFLFYLSSLYDLIVQYNFDVGGFADDNQFHISFKPHSENEAEALMRSLIVLLLQENGCYCINYKSMMIKLSLSSLVAGNSCKKCL